MAKEKKVNRTKTTMVNILESYTTFFELLFEQAIFTDKENKTLKLIYQKLSEISALVEDLKT